MLRPACINLRMSKCTYGSGFSKRKKAIAKAGALQAVMEKTKPIAQFQAYQKGLHQRTR